MLFGGKEGVMNSCSRVCFIMADMAEGVVVIRQVLTLRGIHFLVF